MDMMSEVEKQQGQENIEIDAQLRKDYKKDHTYDPDATHISDMHPAAQAEIEQGIRDHALNMVNIKKAYQHLNMGPSGEQESQNQADYIETMKQLLPEKGEMEYRDEWKKKLEKYIEEGMDVWEAKLRIYREERAGKERVGNEAMRDDIKLGTSRKDFEKKPIKTLEDFKESFEDLVQEVNDIKAAIRMPVEDLAREARDVWVFQEIAKVEEKLNKEASEEDLIKAYSLLTDKWNKDHNFFEE